MRAGKALHRVAAKALEQVLERVEMFIVSRAAITHGDVCLTADNGLDEGSDIRAFILPVGVGIHDHVSPCSQRGVDPAAESGGKPAVAAVLDHVVYSPLARDLRRAIRAAIVDHELLDHVHALYPARQLG